jgi:hypothetical protein
VAVLLALGLFGLFPPGEAGAASSIGLLRNDYNRDGLSDLVGVRNSDGCLSRWRGNGNGAFTFVGTTGCGWEQYRDLTGVGDFNRDGRGDLVGIRRSDGCLGRWRGTSSSSFTYIGDAGCGWEQYRSLAGPGDINGDGVADLIGVRIADGCIARWHGTGSGGFAYAGDVSCVFSPSHLEGVGDINGDGRADVIGTYGTDCIFTFIGTGSGGFSQILQQCGVFDVAGSNGAVGMGDVNGDGAGDLVAPDGSGCLQWWYPAYPGGVLQWSRAGTVTCGWQAYTLA